MESIKEKHTPGPWKIANNGKGLEQRKTATFHIWRNDPVQPDPFRNLGYANIAKHVWGEANAHLIAAAPELLEAAKEVEAWWLREGKNEFIGAPAAIFMIRAAIEKAVSQ